MTHSPIRILYTNKNSQPWSIAPTWEVTLASMPILVSILIQTPTISSIIQQKTNIVQTKTNETYKYKVDILQKLSETSKNTTIISGTFCPEVPRAQLEQSRQLSVQKIHNSLRLHGVQSTFVGVEPSRHRLVLGQVIYEIAALSSPGRHPLSALPHPNPSRRRPLDAGACRGAIRLLRKRLSQRSWECRIGVGIWVRFFWAWALIFGYEFLMGFTETLLVSLLPVATVTIRHFCPIKFSRERQRERERRSEPGKASRECWKRGNLIKLCDDDDTMFCS
jgi:hypothetical protein